MILVIGGNITFDETSATIHEILCLARFESKEEAETFAEENLNLIDAYVIPFLYKGNLIWEDEIHNFAERILSNDV